MIRSLSLVLVAALAFGCKHDRSPQVAFLLSTLHEERYQKDVKYFEERAAEDGFGVITLAADNDSAKQLAQIENVLAQGAKVLVIQPTDSQAAASYVRLAHEHGAKVVAYDRAILSADLDFYVSHDSYRVGVLQAQAALAATHGKGKYVLLAGQAGHSVATEITRGYEDTLAPYVSRHDVEIVVKQNHSAWSPDQAQKTVDDALARTGGHIDAILANNSGLARGAVHAITAAGLANVFIAGADADAANVNLVCEGKQAIEILKDMQPLAKTAADVAKDLLAGVTPKSDAAMFVAGKSVPVAAVHVQVVTAGTVKPLILDSGFLRPDEIPACKAKLAVR